MEQTRLLNDIEKDCSKILFAIQDALDLISGKWKIKVISVLLYGKKNFTDLQRQIDGLGSKMLSKDLQELEINGLITRTVNATKPITVTYELTEYGYTMEPIIQVLADWGTEHRHKITGR
ncbi:transcriptional regulator, HxlR family [Pedobacter westerhofensis]|uniref:Transcriptional regulator, HxlR family n=1 Tax=Pedobacter westerhofensis TaxID=425512 RepID=A0A521CYU9_9SPHI|nr:helix-turn-helix domain-containing protein [Pedobacter westerhofensis]SMO64617.1 transcriptional regulator, HxlR family [Pedobacter westerhofensis]